MKGGGARILLVDDEVAILRALERNLRGHGFQVETATTPADAIASSERWHPDAVILDLGLADGDGHDVIRALRARSAIPVIVLSVRGADRDKVTALDLGADDYLTKPFSPQELSLRVRGLLRRLGSPPVTAGSTLTAGPISIDRSAHRASVGGQELNLTATEYKLLLTLVERRGRVQTRPQLLETVWEAQPDIQTRTVDMHVQRLRTKLGEAGKLIETVRGFGYRFRATERGARAR
jgi:two-component system phosphate regulon response regulator PhoB